MQARILAPDALASTSFDWLQLRQLAERRSQGIFQPDQNSIHILLSCVFFTYESCFLSCLVCYSDQSFSRKAGNVGRHGYPCAVNSYFPSDLAERYCLVAACLVETLHNPFLTPCLQKVKDAGKETEWMFKLYRYVFSCGR